MDEKANGHHVTNGLSPVQKTRKVVAMDAEDFRKAGYAVIDHIVDYNNNLADLPVLPNIQPGYLGPQLPTEAPQDGEAWEKIQADIESKIVPGLTHWQHPNYFAFFPATVSYPSILGEMYSAAFTAPAFNWICSPACTELETIVMDWLAKALALPKPFLSNSQTGGGGVIHGSASEAIVTVMVAARERYLKARADEEGLKEGSLERDDRIAFLRGRLVALGSSEAHSSTKKAAIIAGTRFKTIPVSLKEELAITGSRLQDTLEECKMEGLEPFYLTTSLGTTNSCAVDRFGEVGKVLEAWKGIWVHVDAAFAGSALLCEEFQHLSKEMIVADSFNFNMAKWLLVNFDASGLWVQKRSDLTRALSITPAYLQNDFTDSGLVTDYRDWQIPLGRRFRALKIWFVLRTYGIKGLQQHIRRSLGLGHLFTSMVEDKGHLYEIISTPRFALTCIRIRPELVGGDETEANRVTKEIADLITKRGQIFLTASTVAGKSIIRMVPANANVTEESVKFAFNVILETTQELLEAREA